jgi:hypothetical protein
MRAKAALMLLLTSVNATAAVQCGSDKIGGSKYVIGIGSATLAEISASITLAGYGNRYWYCCPHCNKRIVKLYIGEKDIACRHCRGLHYKSQSEDELA